jgi:hypothetical protein
MHRRQRDNALLHVNHDQGGAGVELGKRHGNLCWG